MNLHTKCQHVELTCYNEWLDTRTASAKLKLERAHQVTEYVRVHGVLPFNPIKPSIVLEQKSSTLETTKEDSIMTNLLSTIGTVLLAMILTVIYLTSALLPFVFVAYLILN